MTGVIWFVQVVHYPLFAAVGADRFTAYEQRHTNRTGYVVAPPMIFELGSALLLAVKAWHTPFSAIAMSALGLVLLNWLSTFLVQVPCHDQLCRGFSTSSYRRLVNTNWIRTAGWSLRSVLLIVLLVRLAH
jgi:hypothetical protein